MHVLSLAISRVVNEFLVSMLEESERMTTVFKTRVRSEKIFKYMKRYVLQILNGFLRNVFTTSSGPGLDFALAHGSSVSRSS